MTMNYNNKENQDVKSRHRQGFNSDESYNDDANPHRPADRYGTLA